MRDHVRDLARCGHGCGPPAGTPPRRPPPPAPASRGARYRVGRGPPVSLSSPPDV